MIRRDPSAVTCPPSPVPRRVSEAALDALAAHDWECVGAPTRTLTHGIHRYPSKFIPQVARYLIEALCPPGGLVLDPFVGSGTTLLEARLAGRRALGFDRNPLALLVARVKTAPPPEDLESLQELVRELRPRVRRLRAEPAAVAASAPDRFPNESRWFPPATRAELDLISAGIRALPDPAARALAAVALSDVIRTVSTADPRFGNLMIARHRRPVPDPFERFVRRLVEVLDASLELARAVRGPLPPAPSPRREGETGPLPLPSPLSGEGGTAAALASAAVGIGVGVLAGDARALPVGEASVDAVVTHPPYLAAVPYAEYQRLSLQWLRTRLAGAIPYFELAEAEPRHLDRVVLGGRRRGADAAERFFAGVQAALAELARVLKPGAPAAIVIGNPCFRGTVVPLDIWFAEAAATVGLALRRQYRRGKYNTTMGKLREEFVQVYERT